MKFQSKLKNGRYLLFLDILGFSNLVKTKCAEEVYNTIDEALETFKHWEILNKQFKTIYFSDTFIFYQETKGYGNWAFLDMYAISGMVLSALLAKGIPARGAISYGEFEVRENSNRHQVYFGEALIEACEAEKEEKWIGITILESAWKSYEENDKGIINGLSGGRVWKKRDDGILMLNPFIKMRSLYGSDLMDDFSNEFDRMGEPELYNEILAFKFLNDTANGYAERNDYSSEVAIKYHTTVTFLRETLGTEIFKWGIELGKKYA